MITISSSLGSEGLFVIRKLTIQVCQEVILIFWNICSGKRDSLDCYISLELCQLANVSQSRFIVSCNAVAGPYRANFIIKVSDNPSSVRLLSSSHFYCSRVTLLIDIGKFSHLCCASKEGRYNVLGLIFKFMRTSDGD